MSRAYEIDVEVRGHDVSRVDEIEDAAVTEAAGFNFDGWDVDGDGLYTYSASGDLCGGEEERHFAKRVAEAIHGANGGPCTVLVRMTCMEDLPYDEYVFPPEPSRDGRAAADGAE